MAGNKSLKLIAMLLPEAGCMAASAAGIFLTEYTGVIRQGTDYMLCHMVLVALGVAILGFGLRMSLIRGELDYDNEEHTGRFWLCFLAGMAVAFVSAFLPTAAWPFLPVFVLLGLFGNRSLGVLAGAVLLTIPVCLTDCGAEVFLMYLISGFFGVLLFRKLENGFQAGGPILLSLSCLLVCETAGTVLVRNARPELEYFLLPAANLIVSGILLFGFLQFFSKKIVYRYRENYLDLNDTENDMLSDLKQRDRSAYMRCVHTAYFCERIGTRLGMNQELLKCVGYYHIMGEELPELMETHSFPPEAVEVLEEYLHGKKFPRHKETAVLLASEAVLGEILQLLEENREQEVDYDKVIDGIFERYEEAGTFRQCDISLREYHAMHKIFKEEKLYYDFLR